MSRSIDTVEKARQAGATEADIQLCWLWLAYVLGPGHPRARNLLRWYGADPITVWRSRNSEGFGRMLGGGARQQERLRDTEQALAVCRRRLDQCSRQGIAILPYGSPDYPRSLLDLPDPPMVLYCIGDPALAQRRQPGGDGWAAAIRTSTACGPPPSWAGSWPGRARSSSAALATGLDGACHQAAVDEKAPHHRGPGECPSTSPIPRAPSSCAAAAIEYGCVVGEYAPGEDGVGKNGFLLRNRLIAGAVPGAGGGAGRGKERHHVHGGTRRAVRPEDLRRARRDGPDALPRLQPPDRPGPRGTGDGRRRHPPPDERGRSLRPRSGSPRPPGPEPPGKRLPPGTLERAVLDRLGARSGQRGGAFRLLPGRYAELSALLMRLELDGAVGPLPGQRYISL